MLKQILDFAGYSGILASVARIACLVLFLAGQAMAAPVESTSVRAAVRDYGVNTRDLEALTDFLEDSVDQGELPNALVHVYRRGQLVWSTRVGYADIEAKRPIRRNSIFRIFSMTKPITAAAVMVLVDDGLLSLQDPISLYLPEFRNMQVLSSEDGAAPKPADSPIRVRDLLTHTDGFTYSFVASPLQKSYVDLGIEFGNPQPEGKTYDSLADMTRALATLPLLHSPGYAWSYGVGLDVAGRLIEAVSQQAFDVFLQERLFEPLGMKDTAFSASGRRLTTLYTFAVDSETGETLKPPRLEVRDAPVDSAWSEPPPVLSGGGGLLSTADDYLQFAGMLLEQGRNPENGKKVLSRHAVRMLMADHMSPAYGLGRVSVSPSYLYPDGNISGLGFGLGGAVQVNPARETSVYSPGSYTWGGAAGTLFWVDPEEDLVVIFMTQAISLGRADPVDRIQAVLANLVYRSLE